MWRFVSTLTSAALTLCYRLLAFIFGVEMANPGMEPMPIDGDEQAAPEQAVLQQQADVQHAHHAAQQAAQAAPAAQSAQHAQTAALQQQAALQAAQQQQAALEQAQREEAARLAVANMTTAGASGSGSQNPNLVLQHQQPPVPPVAPVFPNPQMPVPFATVVNPDATRSLPSSNANPGGQSAASAPNASNVLAQLTTPAGMQALATALAAVLPQVLNQAQTPPGQLQHLDLQGNNRSVGRGISFASDVDTHVGVKGKARPQLPDKYSGDPATESRYSVHDFLFAVENYLTLAREEDETRRITFAVTSLTGRALAYWRDFRQRLSTDRIAALKYSDFAREMLTQFSGAKTEFVYHTELRRLKMTTTMRAYVNEFMRLDSLIRMQPLSDGSRIFQFLDGLNGTEFRDRLLTQPDGKHWGDPAALYSHAETIAAGHDARYGDRKREHPPAAPNRMYTNPGNHGGGAATAASSGKNQEFKHGKKRMERPMERQDKAAKVPRNQWLAQSEAQQKEYKSSGRCFICGTQNDHIAPRCPYKGEELRRVQQKNRQGN